eukprot:1315692-Pyramimonas_sp.AAC.1
MNMRAGNPCTLHASASRLRGTRTKHFSISTMLCIETSESASSVEVASDWSSRRAATSVVLFCVPSAK